MRLAYVRRFLLLSLHSLQCFKWESETLFLNISVFVAYSLSLTYSDLQWDLWTGAIKRDETRSRAQGPTNVTPSEFETFIDEQMEDVKCNMEPKLGEEHEFST